jgi:glycosyltransferase involved in cell wall biosynthesis
MLKVSHFCTSTTGGAAVLMLRLHQGLLDGGVDSRIHYRRGHLAFSNARRLEFAQGLVSRLLERVTRRIENELLRSPGQLFTALWTPTDTRIAGEDAHRDVFHFHWISQWFDLPSLVQSLPLQAAIVFTIHDFGNITGGCHLYSGCHAFQKECCPCPILHSPLSLFLARVELKRKRNCFRGRRVFVVGNSNWTTQMAASSAVFGTGVSCRTIHPGFEMKEFQFHDKSEAKSILGIAPNRFVVGFGCAELTDGNKNFTDFIKVLQRIADRIPVEALVFGNGFHLGDQPPVRIHSVGQLESTRLLSLVYAAMDVFVMTSGIETFGQVAAEAQACGTPVCAFNVGGLSDAVRDGATGLLSPPGDLTRLTEHLVNLGTNISFRERLGSEARRWSRGTFAMDRIVKQYLDLYNEALNTAEMAATELQAPSIA